MDLLLAYEERLREDAWDDYKFATVLFAIGGSKSGKPPEMPAILEDAR